jgi:hypothetical protein
MTAFLIWVGRGGHTSYFSLYNLLFYWQVLRRHRKKNPHTTTPLSGRGEDATPPSTPPCTTCPPTPLPRTNPSQASSSSHRQLFFRAIGSELTEIPHPVQDQARLKAGEH